MLAAWLVGCLAVWLSGCLAVWQYAWQAFSSAGRLERWLVD